MKTSNKSRTFAVSTRVQPAALATLVKYYRERGGVRSASEVMGRAAEDLAKLLEQSGLVLPVSEHEMKQELAWLKGAWGEAPKGVEVKEHTIKRVFAGRATERLKKVEG